MHQKYALLRLRSGRQCVDDGLGCRCRIVADPELEQVTQDDKLEVTRCIGLHETKKSLQSRGPLKRQMQIRNEDRVDQRLDRLRDRQRRRRISR